MDLRERFSSLSEGVLAAVLGVRQQIYTTLPGIIVSFDREKMTASVQPAIKGIRRKQDGSIAMETLPVCPDVPVHYPSGGGYTMTFPIAAGDECLIFFSARNIDNWWQLGDVQDPRDRRMHSLSDGFAMVGIRSQPHVVSDIAEDAVQLRSDDGTLYVELKQGDGKVTIKAPDKIRLEAPVIEITGEVRAEGEMFGKVNGDNISLTDHRHGQVRSGTDQSGPPVDDT